MLQDLPLHPAIVHLPIGLAVVLPLVSLLLVPGFWRGPIPRRAWAAVVLLQALVFVGCLAAEQTAEREEERVERLVGEQLVETHEERAEIFTIVSGVLLALVALPLVLPVGRATRPLLVASVVGTVITAGLAAWTGHAGGLIVHGPSGLAPATAGAELPPAPSRAVHASDEDDD